MITMASTNCRSGYQPDSIAYPIRVASTNCRSGYQPDSIASTMQVTSTNSVGRATSPTALRPRCRWCQPTVGRATSPTALRPRCRWRQPAPSVGPTGGGDSTQKHRRADSPTYFCYFCDQPGIDAQAVLAILHGSGYTWFDSANAAGL